MILSPRAPRHAVGLTGTAECWSPPLMSSQRYWKVQTSMAGRRVQAILLHQPLLPTLPLMRDNFEITVLPMYIGTLLLFSIIPLHVMFIFLLQCLIPGSYFNHILLCFVF